ncbi:asparagine synthase (glutamine-hydrolyzing) [Caulobacter sp. FWC2]|uniref:asparagine synthase (glutamine-hydrolyzing) n=1 Tax=Caulobacter sp. FWC2 TaxID=69664 RepID=UPI000C15ADFA|nr:asparagine synthase (glutamine-hydrolyzing) [Caulobacter sp. FWC2]PIB92155.1 asparagine synthase (glutamine-hydrolyzing) [Caulobacter sp. FWC2]
MCGINGIFAYGAGVAPPQPRELLATRDHMRARGPDGEGAWWSPDGLVGLAHRRLAVIDLADRAAQPMRLPEADLTLVFNGEIYNHRELRAELEARGERFVTQSDTEVILRLYAHEGVAMLRRLRGMFALALWDGRKGGLLLARDPYGIKPLYYADDGGAFRFASQVKALMAGGGVEDTIDPAGWVGFHIFGHVPEPFTLHRNIQAAPAGTAIWVGRDGVSAPAVYTSLARILAEAPPPDAPLNEVLRGAALDSVRSHLLADVEVGLFLSAGVDSGALLDLMRQAGHGAPRALTLVYPDFSGDPRDEGPLAAAMAKAQGARHVLRRVDQAEFEADLPAILSAMDQPSIDGINTWFVAKAAREQGLKVAISGVGGDELLAGYSTFQTLPRLLRRARPFTHVPGLATFTHAALSVFAPGPVRRNPKVLGVLRHARSWGGAYMLRRAVRLPAELDAIMDPEMLRTGLERLNPVDRLDGLLEPDPGCDNGRVALLESRAYLRDQLLRDADWAGMAHGVEIRTPLVDIDLFRAVAPHIAGLSPGDGKRALANATELGLPMEVLKRSKTGFAIPAAHWALGPHGPDRVQSRRWALSVAEAFRPPG